MSWADMCFRKTLYWLELPNSGNTLKHIVPNYSQKIISGWNNYPGMVISYMISENKMGYRGSKSVLLNSIVKEQRVDGSYCIKTPFKYN